jgi:hypothetical protein
MSGAIIRVLPKVDVVGTIVGTTAIETVVARSVDILQFTSVTLIWQIFAKSISGGSTQTANIFVRNAAPTPDDPSQPFVGATIGTATYTINGGTAGPQVPQIISLSTPLAANVQVVLSMSQTTGATALTFSHAITFVGRE